MGVGAMAAAEDELARTPPEHSNPPTPLATTPEPKNVFRIFCHYPAPVSTYAYGIVERLHTGTSKGIGDGARGTRASTHKKIGKNIFRAIVM